MEYDKMLDKLYKEVKPLETSSERFEIPKVKGHIEGYKTIIANFGQILGVLRRNQEHLIKFLFKELATPGIVEGERLILNRKLSSSESKGDGGGGGGIGKNQTAPQNPPSDSGQCINTTTPIGEVNERNDIYGDSKLAVLGDQQIDIRIKPVNYEVSVREEGDVEQKQFDEIFPSQVDIKQSSAYEESIPQEQQELVKNYFNKLAGG